MVLAIASGRAQRAMAADRGDCSPVPWVADSIRVLSPNGGTADRSTDIIIAVKPPGEDVSKTQVFSASAAVGQRRVSVWLTMATPVDDTTPYSVTLRPGERAWGFRVVGAPSRAVVTVVAAHYIYGATTAERPVDCRMLVERPLVVYSTR
jgi:hypothetical protein